MSASELLRQQSLVNAKIEEKAYQVTRLARDPQDRPEIIFYIQGQSSAVDRRPRGTARSGQISGHLLQSTRVARLRYGQIVLLEMLKLFSYSRFRLCAWLFVSGRPGQKLNA